MKETGLLTDFEPLLMNFSYAAYYFYFTEANWLFGVVPGGLSGRSGYPGGGLGYCPDAVYRRYCFCAEETWRPEEPHAGR